MTTPTLVERIAQTQQRVNAAAPKNTEGAVKFMSELYRLVRGQDKFTALMESAIVFLAARLITAMVNDMSLITDFDTPIDQLEREMEKRMDTATQMLDEKMKVQPLVFSQTNVSDFKRAFVDCQESCDCCKHKFEDEMDIDLLSPRAKHPIVHLFARKIFCKECLDRNKHKLSPGTTVLIPLFPDHTGKFLPMVQLPEPPKPKPTVTIEMVDKLLADHERMRPKEGPRCDSRETVSVYDP